MDENGDAQYRELSDKRAGYLVVFSSHSDN